jgi:hypothetical protein
MGKNCKKIFSGIMAIVLVFVFTLCSSNRAHAQGIPVWDIDNLLENILQYTEEVLSYEELVSQYTELVDTYEEISSNDAKQWATMAADDAERESAMNKTEKNLLKSSQSKMITDYGEYLYTAPIKKTATQMDSFFSAASGGTVTSANPDTDYSAEGVNGDNYDQYLADNAAASINGETLKTDITDVVDDPTQPFANGNMQGLMALLECSNNVMCFSTASESKYDQLLDQNQTIAKAEEDNGFVPTKENGKIVAPAESAAYQYTAVEDMDIQAIADSPDDSPEDVAVIEDGLNMITDDFASKTGADSTFASPDSPAEATPFPANDATTTEDTGPGSGVAGQ